MTIDARAARLVADRVGPDVSRLRSDVERLVLYAAGNKAITEADVKEVVGAGDVAGRLGRDATPSQRGSAGDALRELGLMMDNGAVPYMILGQLAWFVRTKVPAPKVSSAVEAVFRTDLAIKTSAGDPRALLERLVVELCGDSVGSEFAVRTRTRNLEPLRRFRVPRAQSRLVAARGVAVNDALAGHLVDQRNRLIQLFLRAQPCPSRWSRESA